MTSYVLAIDQGTTSSRAILFRADISIAAVAPAGIPAAFSGRRRGRARAGGHLDDDGRDLPRRAAQGRRHGQGHRRHRHHQSARDHAAVGPRHRTRRCIAPSSGRTGAPPTSARSSRPTVTKPAIRGQDRTSASIPISPAPSSPGCCDHVPGARDRAARGELAFGTVDTLSAVAAHRRQGARHRRHQRLAHAAVRHPHRRVGTTSC